MLTNISNRIRSKSDVPRGCCGLRRKLKPSSGLSIWSLPNTGAIDWGVEANDGFVKSGIEIKDVYGKLEP